MKEFREFVTKGLVDHPDMVALGMVERDSKTVFKATVGQGDVGQGRETNNIRDRGVPRRNLFAVGRIVKVFGIKGEVVLQPTTVDVSRFKTLKIVYVGAAEGETVATTVTATSIKTRGVRLKLAHCPDRTAAERLVGQWLFVDEPHLQELPRGTYFVHQLVGLNVIDQHGEPLGSVKEVLKLPANDVYVVGHKGRELMIPAVKEFISSIDLTSHTMQVNLIEGMDELA